MNWFARTTKTRNQGRKLRPSVENLESRWLQYAVTGNRFALGTNIRISIMPDGTSLGSVQSNLISNFAYRFGATGWQEALYEAAAWWENVANVNFTLVPDNGAPIGSGPYQQGNPNFGDIRIGGFAQSPGTLAVTISPPPANGDSTSGDIFINTAAEIGGPGGYDLQTIFFHELGHALGLGHSNDPNAAMHGGYRGTKAGPRADDVNGIQAIWGARADDYFTRTFANNSFANAADLTAYNNPQTNQFLMPSLNVARVTTPYWFKVTTPANASTRFAAVVQSTNFSFLSPYIQLFDASGNFLAQNYGVPWEYGTIVGAEINNARPNTTYYVKVFGTSNGSTGNGAYALHVNMGPYNLGPAPGPYTVVANQPSRGGGTSHQSTGTRTLPNHDRHDEFIAIGDRMVAVDTFTVAPNQQRRNQKVQVQVARHHPNLKARLRHLVPTKDRMKFSD